METAVQTLVKVFLKSSKGKENLGKKEFQGLVKSQLGNILSDSDSKEAVNNMGQGLDANQDGKVGFEEYMKLIGYLAVSLSEQRTLAKGEQAQNAASGQVAQSASDKEEATPEVAKPEASEEAKPAAAAAEVKLEANAGGMAYVKEGGVTLPGVTTAGLPEAVTAPAEAAAAAVTEAAEAVEAPAAEVAAEVAAAAEEAAGKAEEVLEEAAEKAEEAAEKVAAAVEEEVEKKTEEATS